MTTPPKDAPVTEAGRVSEDDPRFAEALTAGRCGAVHICDSHWREAATAARSDEIDVETLARAVKDAIPRGYQVHLYPRAAADAIAREYARLRSEQGERTPRVDSEIDAT